MERATRMPQPNDDVGLETPCIATPSRLITVAEYDQIQRNKENQPLWAWHAPAVQSLTDEPGSWGVRIVDRGAYEMQMWHLLGVD